MGSHPNPSQFEYQDPNTVYNRPCAYCNRSWREAKVALRSIISRPEDYLTKVVQVSDTGKRTVTWLCPLCLKDLEQEIDLQDERLAGFLSTEEQIARYRVTILYGKEQEESSIIAR